MSDPEFKSIAIVGARGQMGGLFTERFGALGCAVRPLDRPFDGEKVREAVSACDLLLLCVPVTAMDHVLDLTVPHLRKDAVLADVGSVKELPLRAMLRACKGPVVGTHPLFGPVIPEGFTPRVAVVPGRESDTEAANRVARLFDAAGFHSFLTTAGEHDKAVAFIQGLNFTTTAAFLAAAGRVEGIENYVTPSFNRRLDAARKMLTTDSELFGTISDANPYLQETARQFMSLFSLAAGGELDLLASLAQWWWRNDTQQEGCAR
ncbi:prephenate dehydrogenase/arogenate dehydrogenase family protein [Salidesulfovibrio onnuriiensis]|uniref:prephenate dehydrogenase/arogenate dehydrogenase family protein n=1 Tax=Salidesulfovibrio onnuriiensis TaxID=2583823 RepID=UPI0011C794D4|nr:prephenate dehydrogenase/arogenate dehydrogenase family protein [Salidesulfovibrio onnuriiensis]